MPRPPRVEGTAEFPNDIIIREGVYRATAHTSFGTEADRTYVNGGTIESLMNGSTESSGQIAYNNESFTLAGEGYQGQGAIYQTSQSNYNFASKGGICLEDDVTIGGTHTLEFRYGIVYMNRHCLTNKASLFRYVAITVNRFGSMVADSHTLGFESNSSEAYSTATNVFTVKSGASFYINDTQNPWPRTLDFEVGSGMLVGNRCTSFMPGFISDYNHFSGPVKLGGSIPVTFGRSGTQQVVQNPLNISGYMSGVGGFVASGGGFIQLSNPTNSFQSGVSVTGELGVGDLTVTGGVAIGTTVAARSANGALPLNGGATTVKNGRLILNDDRQLTLPDLVFDGRAVVTGCQMKCSAQSLVKKGSDTLTMFGPMVVTGTTDIQGGIFRFGSRVVTSGFKLYYKYGDSGTHQTADIGSKYPYLGVDVTGAGYAYKDIKTTYGNNGASTHYQCYYYEGYLNVPGETDEDVVCNFVSCFARNASIVIDNSTYVVRISDNKDLLTPYTSAAYKRCFVCPTQTLKAGWHKVLIYLGNSYSLGGSLALDGGLTPARRI